MTDEQLQNCSSVEQADMGPYTLVDQIEPRQVSKFNEVQVRLNTKIAEIEAEKVKELSKIAGIANEIAG